MIDSTCHQCSKERPKPIAVLPVLVLLAAWLVSAGLAQAACLADRFPVALDVGHSKRAFGAVSARGVPEYRFNRSFVGVFLKALQQTGFSRSFIIEPDGRGISLPARASRAAAGGAQALIAVHHDSVQPHYIEKWEFEGKTQHYCDRFQGFSLFYSEKNPQAAASRRLAELMGEELVASGFTPTLHHAEPIPGENRELVNAEAGVYRFDDLIVLKRAIMPAVLIECGVIVHPEEEMYLCSPLYQRQMAGCLVRAVQRFCGEAGVGGRFDGAGGLGAPGESTVRKEAATLP